MKKLILACTSNTPGVAKNAECILDVCTCVCVCVCVYVLQGYSVILVVDLNIHPYQTRRVLAGPRKVPPSLCLGSVVSAGEHRRTAVTESHYLFKSRSPLLSCVVRTVTWGLLR